MKKRLLSLLCFLLTLTLCLLLPLTGCKASEEEIPDDMQAATAQGSLYRLYIPLDWNLYTGTGISGGYSSMTDVVYTTVETYPYTGTDLTAFITDVYVPELTYAFWDNQKVNYTDPVKILLDGHDALYFTFSGTRNLTTYKGGADVCQKDGTVYVLSYVSRADLWNDDLVMKFGVIRENFRFSDTPYVSDQPINTVDTGADAPAGMKLASNDDVAYRFYVPENWILDCALPTSSVYFSEDDRSNVTVTVYMPSESQMTADEYWELCKKELTDSLGTQVIFTEDAEEGMLDGRKSTAHTYAVSLNNKLYTITQTFAAYRGMVYNVTYTAPAEQYTAHYDDYRAMLAAFDFRGN